MKTIILKVDGMSCSGCVRSVEKAIASVEPSAQAEVDLASGTVTVRAADSRERIAEAIEEAGYDILSTS